MFGGTFNPLHNGHLTIARSVLEQGLADEVWMLITPCNPWKKDQILLDDRLRYNMVRDAVKDIHGIDITDMDIYDLIINTNTFDPESIVEIILTTLKVI